MVDEHAETAPWSGLEGRDQRGQIVDAVQAFHDDALHPQVVAPDAFDECGVVQPLHVDPARPRDPGRLAGHGDGAGRRAGRGRRRRPHRPGQRHRPPVQQERSGGEREGAAAAVPVLQHDPTRLNLDHRPAETGRGVLDDKTGDGLDRWRRGGPYASAPRQHVGPVVSAAHPTTVTGGYDDFASALNPYESGTDTVITDACDTYYVNPASTRPRAQVRPG